MYDWRLRSSLRSLVISFSLKQTLSAIARYKYVYDTVFGFNLYIEKTIRVIVKLLTTKMKPFPRVTKPLC